MSEDGQTTDAIEQVLLAALRTAGAGPAGVDQVALSAAVTAATDRQLADALLKFLHEAQQGGGTDWQFQRLTAAGIALCREGLERSDKDTTHAWAIRMLAERKARLELRVGFTPLPWVTGELIAEDDGRRLAKVFDLQARAD